jgi:ribose 5-phosphate isomerase B
MKIVIASDHRGYKLKEKIKTYLINENYLVEDVGTYSKESADYPIYANKLCKKLQTKEAELGIAICGTGIGMSIACNKNKDIYCAKVNNVKEAILSKEHNNANVIALNEQKFTNKTKKIIIAFLETKFSDLGKHKRRINEIEKIGDKND